eukprot:CAMPEP_0204912988 /NCGR_PEP_ID=MMETSP1397-20131031/11040_1 /ASSEMBLY_ACC=CAM_ASM_000891 /TAXON_ID=49980 /ORGANISM="Climacostomum Climacostomum virens, Strain Stock W-24" /LENGTH=286 /DNA_ID=CAMNT_0052084153 /DNA_START=8 /DNA_END=868 /DNA_ORIENTATION=-
MPSPLTLTTEVNSVLAGKDLAGVVCLDLPKPVVARFLNLKFVRNEEYTTVGGTRNKESIVVASSLLHHWPDDYVPQGIRDYQFLMQLPRGIPGDFLLENDQIKVRVYHTLVAELNSGSTAETSKQIEVVSENLFEAKELRASKSFNKSRLLCFGKSTASVTFTTLNAVSLDSGITVKLEADLTHSLQSLRNIELRLIRRIEVVASRAFEETVCSCSLDKVTKGRNYSDTEGFTLKLGVEAFSQQCTSLARNVKLKYRLEASFEALNQTRVMRLGQVGVYAIAIGSV